MMNIQQMHEAKRKIQSSIDKAISLFNEGSAEAITELGKAQSVINEMAAEFSGVCSGREKFKTKGEIYAHVADVSDFRAQENVYTKKLVEIAQNKARTGMNKLYGLKWVKDRILVEEYNQLAEYYVREGSKNDE